MSRAGVSTTHVIAWDSAEKKNNQDILPLSHLTHAVTWMVCIFTVLLGFGGEKTLKQCRSVSILFLFGIKWFD